MKDREIFWLKMLRLSSLFILLTGLLPSLAVFEATQKPWLLFFDLLTWPLDGHPSTFIASERQLSAVLGGVLCGWAWMMYKLADPEVFNSRVRRLMIQSTWVWFLLDSSGSILSGLPLNAVGNTGFLLMLILPLSALKSIK